MTQAETSTQRGGSRGDRFGASATADDVTPGAQSQRSRGLLRGSDGSAEHREADRARLTQRLRTGGSEARDRAGRHRGAVRLPPDEMRDGARLDVTYRIWSRWNRCSVISCLLTHKPHSGRPAAASSPTAGP